MNIYFQKYKYWFILACLITAFFVVEKGIKIYDKIIFPKISKRTTDSLIKLWIRYFVRDELLVITRKGL